MKIDKKVSAAIALASISAATLAAPTAYEFESVTALKLDRDIPSITGVLRNTATPTTVQFFDRTNVSYRYVVSRCVPVFLTMMEKPGKYYLSIVVDPADTSVSLVSCYLEVR